MALSPQEEQELRELEELDQLEALEAHSSGQATAAPTARRDDPGMAALEGFGSGAAVGYLPQLQAAVEPAMTKVMDLATGQDVSDSLPSYVDRRDENIQRQAELARDNAGANFAGKAAGILTSGMALPSAAAAKGAGLATKIGAGMLNGGVVGAVANPGDVQGEVDPIQYKDRAANAGIGAATGGLLSAAGAGVNALADKSRMVDRVKDSAGLSKSVKGEIDGAIQGVNENYISPRRDRLMELLKGKEVQINPDRIEDTLPTLAKSMKRNVDESGRRTMSAARGDRLKRLLDAKASYNNSKPFDVSAVAKGEEAKAGADILRGQLHNLDPEVSGLYGEIGDSIRLRDSLSRQAASTPIASIKGRPGTDKGSLIDAIDKMGGSKLEKLSNNISSASDLLIEPSNLVKPLQLPNELRKMGVRGAAGLARGAEVVAPENSLQDAIRALMEAKRK